MSQPLRSFLLSMILSGAGVAATPAAAAQSPADEVAELQALVRELSLRVTELERRLAGDEGDAANPPATPSGQAPHAGADRPTAAASSWRDGLRWRSADGTVELEARGRLAHDWTFLSADDDLERHVGGVSDGSEFRRARLSVAATFRERFEVVAGLDFADDGRGEFRDVGFSIGRLPGGSTLKVGHFKEPFSLDEVSSSRTHPLLERSAATALAPGRNAGLTLQGHAGRRLSWSVGTYRDTDDFGRSEKGGESVQVTGRLTGLPWRRDGDHLLHLGIAHSRRHADFDLVRFEARPEVHQAPGYLRAGPIPLDGGLDLTGVELALLAGRFSLQAERTRLRLPAANGDRLELSGGYALVSAFVTGGRRRYRESTGRFSGVEVGRATYDGGPGAVEAVLRYSDLDLNDGFVRGGRMESITLGANWYSDENTRLGVNWVRSDIDGIGRGHAVVIRLERLF